MMGERELNTYGIVVAVCSHIVQSLSLGCTLSMGVFYTQYMNYFKESASKTGFVYATGQAVALLSGPFVSVLVNRFGVRPVVIAGGLLSSAGLFLSTFASSVEMLYITYGLVTGVGTGLSYGPSVVILGKHFRKYFSLMNGIAGAGVGVGMMALPPLYQVLIDKYGWKGALMVASGVNLHIVACGCLMREPRESRRRVLPPDKKSEVDGCDSSRAYDDQNLELSHLKEAPPDDDGDPTEDKTGTEEMKQAVKIPAQRQTLTNACSLCIATSGASLFYSHRCLVLFFSTGVVNSISSCTALMYFAAMLTAVGVSPLRASLLMTILGSCSLVGTALSGIMAAFGKLSSFVVHFSHVFFAGLALLLVPVSRSYPIYAILCAVFGFCYGVHWTVVPVCLTEKLGARKLSSGLGWWYVSIGLGNLLGPPIAGGIYDFFADYKLCFVMAGSLHVIAAISVMLYYSYDRCRMGTSVLEEDNLAQYRDLFKESR